MEETLAVAKALADESRLRVLAFVGSRELCVCQVIEMLQLAPSTVSKHLNLLHEAGLLEARKEGRWVHYRLARDGSPVAREVLRMLKVCLDGDAQARGDAMRVSQVRRMDLEELCCRYKNAGARKSPKKGCCD